MIFCVEDDAGIRDLMIYTLNASGFRAVGFENAREFYAALADDTPELIMLDIMLPGEDGISILKRLKADARTADIPVIMATAKGNEYDKVIGLDLGADDYLAKPFGMMEMASRVRAVLRRSGRAAEKPQLIRVGGLEMNLGEHIVTADGIRILYGGSAKPENVGGFLEKEDVDGALVGGASLKADSFAAMVRSAMA